MINVQMAICIVLGLQFLILFFLIDIFKKKEKKPIMENKPDLLEDCFPPDVILNEKKAVPSAVPSSPAPSIYSNFSIPSSSSEGRNFPVLQQPSLVVVNVKMPQMEVKYMEEKPKVEEKPKINAPKNESATQAVKAGTAGSKKQIQAVDMVRNLKAAIKGENIEASKIVRKLELKLGDEPMLVTERKLVGEKASRFDVRGLPAQMRLNAEKKIIEFVQGEQIIGWVKFDSVAREIVFTTPLKAEEIKPRDCGQAK